MLLSACGDAASDGPSPATASRSPGVQAKADGRPDARTRTRSSSESRARRAVREPWTRLAESPLSLRESPVVAHVATDGTDLVVVVGGSVDVTCPPQRDCVVPELWASDGAAYDMASSTWRLIAEAPRPIGPDAEHSVVDGRLQVVTDGVGLVWDAATGTWEETGSTQGSATSPPSPDAGSPTGGGPFDGEGTALLAPIGRERPPGGWPVEAAGDRWNATGGFVYDAGRARRLGESRVLQPPEDGPSEPGPAVWVRDVLVVYGGLGAPTLEGLADPRAGAEIRSNGVWAYRFDDATSESRRASR